jgi:glycosyltransferase involved in cell wall biosynthesis
LHFIPYLAAKKTNGKFIVAIAHDLDVMSFWKKFVYEYKPKFNLIQFLTLFLPNDLGFDYLLKRSDYITIQHSGQMVSSRKVRGKVCLYANIFDQTNVPHIKNPSRDYFIHVGSLTILKGSDKLYELIKAIDKKNEIIIVGQLKDPKSKKIFRKISDVENVNFKGRLAHSETLRLIANARALINTSNFEGFPNIFLEAWGTGVPVISLKVNPGDIINQYHLGVFCNGSLERMKDSIESNETCSLDKSSLMSYVSEFHSLGTAADRFLKIIN